MSVKEIKEAIEKGNIYFGIKQALKQKARKKLKVFVSKDARQESVDKIEKAGIRFDVLNKSKEDLAKELSLNFKSEIFSIK